MIWNALTRLLLLAALLSALVAFFIPAPSYAATALASLRAIREQIQNQLGCTVDESGEIVSLDNGSACSQQLFTIYLETSGNPLWVDQEGPSEKGWAIIRHLKDSNRHGISPARYSVPTIMSLLPSQRPDSLARLDILLSSGLIDYHRDLSTGILPPAAQPDRNGDASLEEDPLIIVLDAMEDEDLETTLEKLAPSHHYYTGLQRALETYRSIAASGGWLEIPEGPALRPGETDPRIKAVKLRLLKTDWQESVEQTGIDGYYSASLKAAVMHFQKRHNLQPDGVIGQDTLAAMNVPVGERLEAIRLNLFRWHGLRHDLGEKYILVNIPAYTLQAVDEDKVILDMPVVVGNLENKTPTFSDMVTYIVFNPYWTITPNIARTEELPALRKNPYHLVDRHIRLFSSWYGDAIELDSTTIDWHTVTPNQMAAFRLRQDPGPWNSLGKLKFVFPNHHSVYLHDTSAQGLFSLNTRSLSHGCVRVSDPPGLAHFFLEKQAKMYSMEDILAMYRLNERIVITLANPVPVHLSYQTAWVDKDGSIHFTSDIYGLDKGTRNYLYIE